MMHKRAVLYARVSTDDQADKGYSLPSQIELCRKYAERLGFTIVAEFLEDHSGATPIAERPEGKKMAALIKSRQADAVVAYQVDRLSRDIVDLLATVRIWIRAGIEVHACDIGKIESELDIVLVIKGWQGSDERKKIIERTSRGRYTKAQKGKVVGNGKPPFGYRYEDGSLIIVESEAKIVILVFHWYVYGDGDNKPMTMWKIAVRLTEMGFPTPSLMYGRRVNRRRENHIWSLGTIRSILSNETYAGVWRYGKRIGFQGLGGKRAQDELVTVQVPALIDRGLFDAAEKRRSLNKLRAKRNSKREYLLSGHIRCTVCDYAMTGAHKSNGQGSRFYRCGRYRFTQLEKGVCKRKQVRADLLEEIAWNYILSLIENAKDFEAALRLAQKREQESFEPKREQLQTLMEQIAEDEQKATELADTLFQTSEGTVKKMLQEKIAEFERLHDERLKRRDELQSALTTQPLNDAEIAAALQFRADIIEGMKEPNFEDKRRVLDLLRVKVEYANDKVIVKCVIPIASQPIDITTSRND
ncbi:MAG: recombinase family protein [Chloroflexi bacterium]|nr:recombinase family protein [Chloroflexota bacterium]